MSEIKFGYTVIYVNDVKTSLDFFENAFGLKVKFLHESGQYGELETGNTTLAFASHNMGNMNFAKGYIKLDESKLPVGFEVVLITDNIIETHNKAIAHGATEISKPETKPWGEVVSYLRNQDGIIIELCTKL